METDKEKLEEIRKDMKDSLFFLRQDNIVDSMIFLKKAIACLDNLLQEQKE